MKAYYIIIVIAISTILQGCKKDFLDEKPSKALVVPKTLEDFQALLDNSNQLTGSQSAGSIACGDFRITNAAFQNLPEYERMAYIWDKDYVPNTSGDWTIGYWAVFYANVVLDGLEKIPVTSTNQAQLNQVRGSALFYRGFAFYNLAQVFAQVYDENNAESQPGIPLSLSSDVNKRPGRGTVKSTYQQILSDLSESEKLLPSKIDYTTRPSKGAASALLARTYLSMSDYTNALLFADKAMILRSELIDFNTLDSNLRRPFTPPIPDKNPEIYFYSNQISNSFSRSALTSPNPIFFNSYSKNDLRRVMFFTLLGAGLVNYKGHYTGNNNSFGGLTTPEIYLIKAECLARSGKTTEAMQVLNSLMEKRWVKGTFVPLEANDPQTALTQILMERQKELTGKGQRWTDLRRLNKEPDFAVTLRTEINNKIYELLPGDSRYVFHIPNDEIMYNKIEQNVR